MQITYLLPAVGHCGGQKIIAEHVTRLNRQYGHDARVFTQHGSFAEWYHYPVATQRFESVSAMLLALSNRTGPIVATTPETVDWALMDKKNRAKDDTTKHYYFIQDEDENTYQGVENGLTYKAGLFHIYESIFVERHINKKYGTKGYNIGIAIDPMMYHFQPYRQRNMFRILAPFRSDDGGPGELKGFDITCDVLNTLVKVAPTDLHKKISVVTYGRTKVFDANRYNLSWTLHYPHIHMHNAYDVDIVRTMNESGVFLHTSRHEGFGLPLLESMACGLPIVCTDSHGNREHCKAFMLIDPTPVNMAKLICEILLDMNHWSGKQYTGLRIAENYKYTNGSYGNYDPIARLNTLFAVHERGGNMQNETDE